MENNEDSSLNSQSHFVFYILMSRIQGAILESISKEAYCPLGYGLRCVWNEWRTLQSMVSNSLELIITHFDKTVGQWRQVAEA